MKRQFIRRMKISDTWSRCIIIFIIALIFIVVSFVSLFSLFYGSSPAFSNKSLIQLCDLVKWCRRDVGENRSMQRRERGLLMSNVEAYLSLMATFFCSASNILASTCTLHFLSIRHAKVLSSRAICLFVLISNE